MQQSKMIKPFDGVIRRRSNLHKGQNLVREVLPVAKLEYKTNSKRAVVYSSLKMVGVLSVALTLIIGVSSIGGTVSYFSDVEKSVANRLQAGILALRLSGGYEEESLLENPAGNLEENTGTRSFEVDVSGTESGLPMLYKVSGKLDSSNPTGCELMNLKVDFGEYHFEGAVFEFSSPETTVLGEWYFVTSLPLDGTGLPPGALCRGEIVFQAGLANTAEGSSNTFTDVKTYPFEVYNWNSGEETVEKYNAPASLLSAPTLESNSEETTEEDAVETPVLEPDIDPILPPTPQPAPDLGGNGGGGGSPTPAPEPTPEPEVVAETPTPETLSIPEETPQDNPQGTTEGDIPPPDAGPPPTEIEEAPPVTEPEPPPVVEEPTPAPEVPVDSNQ